MSKTTTAALRTTTAVSRDSFWNRIRKAFNTKDAEALENAIGEAESALSDGAVAPGGAEGAGAVHVHVYGNKPDDGGAPAAETKDEAEPEAAADPMKAINDTLAAINARLDKRNAAKK